MYKVEKDIIDSLSDDAVKILTYKWRQCDSYSFGIEELRLKGILNDDGLTHLGYKCRDYLESKT